MAADKRRLSTGATRRTSAAGNVITKAKIGHTINNSPKAGGVI
jgi:hypothetical protein